MEYLKVKNWEKFQHYTDRNPPWIKLYHTLLDDYDYGCLQDDSKLLLISLYLLASRTNNKIPNDPNWIKNRAMLENKPDTNQLINVGFLEVVQDDSKVIAGCKQNACPETETETENTPHDSDSNEKPTIKERAKEYRPYADDLSDIIRTTRNVTHSSRQISQWCHDFRKLFETNNVSHDRIKEALKWYRENAGGQYVPVIEGGPSFREKFVKLEAAMKRELGSRPPLERLT